MNESTHENQGGIAREIVIDLLPLYLAGEASAASRALVEQAIARDPGVRRLAQDGSLDELRELAKATRPLPADVEVRSLRRARSLIRWQRRAYAWALALTCIALSGVGHLRHGHPAYHFFFSDYPRLFAGCGALALSAWINYAMFRRRARATRL